MGAPLCACCSDDEEVLDEIKFKRKTRRTRRRGNKKSKLLGEELDERAYRGRPRPSQASSSQGTQSTGTSNDQGSEVPEGEYPSPHTSEDEEESEGNTSRFPISSEGDTSGSQLLGAGRIDVDSKEFEEETEQALRETFETS